MKVLYLHDWLFSVAKENGTVSALSLAQKLNKRIILCRLIDIRPKCYAELGPNRQLRRLVKHLSIWTSLADELDRIAEDGRGRRTELNAVDYKARCMISTAVAQSAVVRKHPHIFRYRSYVYAHTYVHMYICTFNVCMYIRRWHFTLVVLFILALPYVHELIQSNDAVAARTMSWSVDKMHVSVPSMPSAAGFAANGQSRVKLYSRCITAKKKISHAPSMMDSHSRSRASCM